MTEVNSTQTGLIEHEVWTSKKQLKKDLSRIEYMMDDLWGYTELDELGITQDVFVMYERLTHIQEVMMQESMEDNGHGY